jgi:hypothetical protein
MFKSKETTTIHFHLRASDVSALAGRHAYRHTRQAIWDLVTSILPLRDGREERLKLLTQQIEDKVRTGRFYQQAVGLAELNDCICRSAERESMEMMERFKLDISPIERKKMRRNIRSVYLKDRGVIMELHTLKRLNTVGVHWHPTEKRQRFFTRTFVSRDRGISYTVNGCVDGIEFDDQNKITGLIEIKTRRDKAHFPMHDLDQVMMYLILSDLPKARLVQDVNGTLHTEFIMTAEEAHHRWESSVRHSLEESLLEAAESVRRFGNRYSTAPVENYVKLTDLGMLSAAIEVPSNIETVEPNNSSLSTSW